MTHAQLARLNRGLMEALDGVPVGSHVRIRNGHVVARCCGGVIRLVTPYERAWRDRHTKGAWIIDHEGCRP